MGVFYLERKTMHAPWWGGGRRACFKSVTLYLSYVKGGRKREKKCEDNTGGWDERKKCQPGGGYRQKKKKKKRHSSSHHGLDYAS